MKDLKIRGERNINTSIKIPGDKSISHRAIILSSISNRQVRIRNILRSEDTLATINIMRQLGVEIWDEGPDLLVEGVGLRGLKEPKSELYCGNSGTTMRLVAGLLAGQDFDSVLVGDSSLSKRPMERIIEPLRLMGAEIESKNGRAPLYIKGGQRLRAIEYRPKQASAQVKSAIILASLYSETGPSKIIELEETRNHTELMLDYFQREEVDEIYVPADLSSAAYFIVWALISKNSKLKIEGLGLNPTRRGLIDLLMEMGGQIDISGGRRLNNEYIADLEVSSSNLRAVDIGGSRLPGLIDEIPIIAVAASFAEGGTRVSSAQELRVKESDRIEAIVKNLNSFNIAVTEYEDGFFIEPGKKPEAGRIYDFGDHRILMAFIIMALNLKGESYLENPDLVKVSFPEFFQIIENI